MTNAPVSQQSRLAFLDVLRGLAVLAIFAVNIKAMIAPFPYYNNPTLWTGAFDMEVAALQAFLIDDKWRTIFTMLFGAGIALIATRARDRGANSLGLLSRRLFFLGVFGMIHLLLIWDGDILFTYAAAGFLAIWFRHLSAKLLMRWCIALFAVAFVWTAVFDMGPAFIPEVRAEIEPFLWGTDPVWLEGERATMLGGVADHIENRLIAAQDYLLLYFLAGGHWLDTLVIMLAGMWAYRIGFFSTALSAKTYRRAAIIGLGLAFVLDVARWSMLSASGWDFGVGSLSQILNRADGYAGAVGYAGLVGLAVKSGWAPRALAATGQMAFTNYIACSLTGTTLAYGHGFSLFGSLTNLQLMGIVVASWLAILIWSPLWLSRFRFGPLEWLWRSLTYGKAQPFFR